MSTVEQYANSTNLSEN